MGKHWSVISSRVIHEARPHRLRLDHCRTPRGVEIPDYFVREVNDIAMVFALTASREAVLVRQYRHGAGEETLELPQGILEDGEDPEAGGARELREETGFAAPRLQRLGEMLSNPAAQTSRLHLLFGEPAHDTGLRAPEPDEDLDILLVPVEELEPLVEQGRIRAAGSVAGILLALRHLERRA